MVNNGCPSHRIHDSNCYDPRVRLLVFCWLAATAFAEPMAWKLEPSDFLRFDRRHVKLKDGKESFGAPNFVTIYGHQTLGQFAPVSPGRPDLAALFAFRLPGGKKSFKLALRGTIALKVRGDVALDGEALLGNFRFESRGKPNRDDTHEILDGHAATRMSFDK